MKRSSAIMVLAAAAAVALVVVRDIVAVMWESVSKEVLCSSASTSAA